MRLWLMLLLSILALGCSKEGKPCPDDKDCGDELLCETVTQICQSICGKSVDCGKGLDCDMTRGVCFSRREVRERLEQEKLERLMQIQQAKRKQIEQEKKDEVCRKNIKLCKLRVGAHPLMISAKPRRMRIAERVKTASGMESAHPLMVSVKPRRIGIAERVECARMRESAQ